jgi:hypothetical protein
MELSKNNKVKGSCFKYETVEYQIACQQILNELGELFFSEGRVEVSEIIETVLCKLDGKFTRLDVAKITGLSVRTVRNKLNGRRKISTE